MIQYSNRGRDGYEVAITGAVIGFVDRSLRQGISRWYAYDRAGEVVRAETPDGSFSLRREAGAALERVHSEASA